MTDEEHAAFKTAAHMLGLTLNGFFIDAATAYRSQPRYTAAANNLTSLRTSSFAGATLDYRGSWDDDRTTYESTIDKLAGQERET